jgi:hypothetical protein
MTGCRQQKPKNGLTKCPDLVDRYTHNRKEQKERDKKLYKARHPVEKSFLHLSNGRELRQDTPKIRARSWQLCSSALHVFVGHRLMTTASTQSVQPKR